ncbi:MAG: sugar phosphate isomerase/epimerase [bacterium]|nr:sugar phosphate isomerase/epimerase [bacterium]
MTDIKTSTTTLGCPAWDLATIVSNLSTYGYDAVDFRGVGDEIDVTKLAAFTTGLGETRRMLDDVGLAASCVSSSIRVCDAQARDASLEEARRTIPVALGLGAPSVRVFGGGDVEASSRDDLAKVGAETVSALLALDGAGQIQWCFETHDHWIVARDVNLLLDAVQAENFGVVWDVGHTTRVGDEDPAQSWAAYGSRVFNTHFKDAVYDPYYPPKMDDGWHYVPLGEGTLPLAEAVHLLRDNGYSGYLTLEHEKRWHGELAEPESAFPQALGWFREALAG